MKSTHRNPLCIAVTAGLLAALAVLAPTPNSHAASPSKTAVTGKRAPTFHAKTVAGQNVNFPADYKGKLVLLDFWATWCGPCIKELPHLTAAYEKFRGQGLDVLGVSLDRENSLAKLQSFTKNNKMPWPQVYDGGYWKAAVAVTYDIHSIPSAFLVDGDTGVIVAAGTSLRGERLAVTIQSALAAKKGGKR